MKTADHFQVNPEWLALRDEPVLDPDLPIVDPHHHLWDRPGWRYLFDDLLHDVSSGHNVRATVYAQCRAMYRAGGPEADRPLGETEFVTGAAAMSASGAYGPSRLCAGIIGYADLRLGASVETILEAHRRIAGDRFKGVRYSTAWDADPSVANPELGTRAGLLADPMFRDGLTCLTRMGLVFDAWVYHPQIDEVVALARAFPDTTIVVNHLGGPVRIGSYAARQDALFPTWKASIERLASCRNVQMKIGGLAMRVSGTDFHTRSLPPTSDELASAFRPWVETTIEAFGADRCMFESNFPVDKASCSYKVLWNAFKRLAGSASADERAQLFAGTAGRVYGLTADE